MERANNARSSQHVTTSKRHNYIAKFEARASDVCYIDGIEQEEVVMGFAGWRRTWPTIADEAIAVHALGEGMIAFQFAHIARDVIDDPVMETAVYGCIIVRNEQHETRSEERR